jgi:hypothetical protein
MGEGAGEVMLREPPKLGAAGRLGAYEGLLRRNPPKLPPPRRCASASVKNNVRPRAIQSAAAAQRNVFLGDAVNAEVFMAVQK